MNYHHTGDLGDIIASFPVIREMGRGELIISDCKFPLGHGPRESLRGKRFEALQPIFKATEYVTGISWHDNPKGVFTHDIASFRGQPWKPFETLTQWQGRHFGLKLPAAPVPWLHVADAPAHGKIVIGRTARYHTNFFPWRLIIEKYHKDIMFVGTNQEYSSFSWECLKSKVDIHHHRTENLYDAAKFISGARLYIGGQSVLFWIAAGLGVQLIQETHDQIYTRNSIVPRDNAYYTDCQSNLVKVYDLLDLDRRYLECWPVPYPQVLEGTSALDIRRNLSTSAEIFQARRERKDHQKSLALKRTRLGLRAPGFN